MSFDNTPTIGLVINATNMWNSLMLQGRGFGTCRATVSFWHIQVDI